ncbi:hypothetical protein [Bizionia sp.]|uniref:hypothetical protein n=1 Tax=Bizionia sp. TaxID=1954480 RepID=UPI003A913EBF
MKKILFTALLCLHTIAFCQTKTNKFNTTIQTEVNFGRLGADCHGRGICSFNTSDNSKVNSELKYLEGGYLEIILFRAKISKDEEIKIFGEPLKEGANMKTTSFVMEEPLVLSETLKNSLKIGKEITKIRQGNYPNQVTESTFVINLKLE